MNERMILTGTFFFTYILILTMQILAPKLSRKNLFLGVKLPESFKSREEVRDIYKSYLSWNLVIGLGLGILFSLGHYLKPESIVLMLVLPILYIGALFLIYLRSNKALKDLKNREDWKGSSKAIRLVDTRSKLKAKGILTWCPMGLLIGLVNFLIGIIYYDKIPEKIITHWNFNSIPDGFSDKTLFSVLGINIFHVIMFLIMYMAYLSIVRSRIEIDPDDPEGSIEANLKYKKAWISYLKFCLLSTQLIFLYTSLASYGFIKSMKNFTPLVLAYSFLLVVYAIFLSLRYGQSGDRTRKLKEEDHYYMEDDSLWILGNTIYYNPKDPAVFVEKRFGVGWTINLANKFAIGFIAIVLIITIISLVFSFGWL